MDRLPTSRPASGLRAASCRQCRRCAPVALLTLLLVSLLGAQAQAALQGNFDGIDSNTIHGWAWDNTQPNSPLSVDIYDGANLLATVPASAFSQTLLTKGYGNGYHAFSLPTPASVKDGLKHSLTIDYSGTSTGLGASPRSYTYTPPNGVYTAGAGLALSPLHQFSIAPGGVVQAMIANGAVTTTAIADGSVTAAKLAPGVLSGTATPAGAAGGDLTGTYPNPTVAPNAIDHTKLISDMASLAQVSGGGLTASSSGITVNGALGVSDYFYCHNWGAFTGGISTQFVELNGDVTGNNGGLGRALVNNGSGGLVLNQGNDFGIVEVQSDLKVDGGFGVNGDINCNGGVAIAGQLGTGSNIVCHGQVTANSISITGGSDLAEPYKIATGLLRPLPGMVVSIDPAHPGQMRVCTAAYDATVGGILSGANGIQPGIVLRQAGTIADGTLPVASTGRVWCFCDADAGGGPIHPGDLLTTSATPGHAMRARDYDKARGAILGKAMSPLKSGKGLVLVLVTLE